MIDFRTLVRPLEEHPDIWLARAQFLPGASEETLQKAEAELGTALDPELRAFYAHHDGLAIEWMYKKTNRYQPEEYQVDPAEMPYFMDLMADNHPPYDGQIIIVPIREWAIGDYSTLQDFSDLDPYTAYVQYIRDPWQEHSGPYQFGNRNFASQEGFHDRLRMFDFFLSDDGNLLLFEEGKSDPDLLHLEGSWQNFDARYTLPVSRYLQHVAYDLGVVWDRGRYFQGAEPAPTEFDPESRLKEVLAETDF